MFHILKYIACKWYTAITPHYMVYFKINGNDFPQTSGPGNMACLFSSKPLATK